jgi:hypothetical protein
MLDRHNCAFRRFGNEAGQSLMQAQHRKIEQLEADLRSTKMQLQESNSIQIEALQRHAEMQQELENNAGELGGNGRVCLLHALESCLLSQRWKIYPPSVSSFIIVFLTPP